MINVDKNVPMPKKKTGVRAKHPWDVMAVGDSFLYSGKLASAQSTASLRGTKGPRKFSARNTDAGPRIWRTA